MNYTAKVSSIINSDQMTKHRLAEKIGISRNTLDVRLTKGGWKKGEKAIIEML